SRHVFLKNANLSERDIAIKRGDLFPHGASESGRIGQARARDGKQEIHRKFPSRARHFRGESFLGRKMSDVSNNAYNLTHLRLLIADAPARLDAFADHILSRKEFLR